MSRFTISGRLVQGNPHDIRQRVDSRTRQPRTRLDAATGQQVPLMQVYCAIAIPKDPAQRLVIKGNPTWDQTRALLDADARAAWPQFFGQQRNPNLIYPTNLAPDCTNPSFANKIIDGDGFDEKGNPYSANEGWGGCWIVKCANGFAPKVYAWTTTGWQETIHTGHKIKTGDYVTISGDCTTNSSNDSPGMYMNFDTVSFEYEGAFIASASAVDPNAALGQRGPVQPVTQDGTPTSPAPVNAAPVGQPVHGGQPSTTASPAYDGYRTNGAAAPAAPPPPVTPPAPPPPAGPQMTAAATASYEAYRSAGWTDEQLRAGGLMV